MKQRKHIIAKIEFISGKKPRKEIILDRTLMAIPINDLYQFIFHQGPEDGASDVLFIKAIELVEMEVIQFPELKKKKLLLEKEKETN